jgi:hypothetical protein
MAQKTAQRSDDIEGDLLTDAFAPVALLEQDKDGRIVQNFAAQDRVFGAQAVAVRRDERAVLQKLKTIGGAVGEEWFYRWPVTDKKGKTTWIEGPSIKLANDLWRYYGNCDVTVAVEDKPENPFWIFHARFMDLESGAAMVRLFQQRKSQAVFKTDAERARDIAFQIGQSKAIRNVVVNALQTLADYAFKAARDSLIEKVGKNLVVYRDKCATRLRELNVDLLRVEAVRGRKIGEWLAHDVAMTIGEIKAIGDGMATADEMWPVETPANAGPRKPPDARPIAPGSPDHPDNSVDADGVIDGDAFDVGAYLGELSARMREARSLDELQTIWNDFDVEATLQGDDGSRAIADTLKADLLKSLGGDKSATPNDGDGTAASVVDPPADASSIPPQQTVSAADQPAAEQKAAVEKAALKVEAVDKLFKLATSKQHDVDTRRDLLGEAEKDWIAALPDDREFVRTVVKTCLDIVSGAHANPESAHKYLLSLVPAIGLTRQPRKGK